MEQKRWYDIDPVVSRAIAMLENQMKICKRSVLNMSLIS